MACVAAHKEEEKLSVSAFFYSCEARDVRPAASRLAQFGLDGGPSLITHEQRNVDCWFGFSSCVCVVKHAKRPL